MEKFLRLLRAEAERNSHIEVAYRLGVSEATLRRWLAGERTPRGDVVLRALQVYPALLKAVVPNGTAGLRKAQGVGAI